MATRTVFCECCKCSVCVCGRKLYGYDGVLGETAGSEFEVRDGVIVRKRQKDLHSYGKRKPFDHDVYQDAHGYSTYLLGEDYMRSTDSITQSELARQITNAYLEKISELEKYSALQRALSTRKEKSQKSLLGSDGGRKSDELSSGLSETSSCQCMHDICTCVKFHEEKASLTENLDEDREKKTREDKKESGIYIWKENECPCDHGEKLYPSLEGSHDVSTVPSRLFQKGSRKNLICTYDNTYQRTIVIVKPDAMIFKEVIKRAFLYIGGLNIINERLIYLTPEQVADLYLEKHFEKLNFPLFVLQLSRKPISVLSIGGLNAVEIVKFMVGPDEVIPSWWFFPESIRRRICIASDIPEAMHASEDVETAAIEGRYFFPHAIQEIFPKTPIEIEDYCGKYINPILNKGLTAVASSKPKDPISFLAEWLLMHNTNIPFYRPEFIKRVAI